MTRAEPVLVDNDGLTRMARNHFGNWSILYPEHSLRRYYLPTPLSYLTPHQPDSRHILYHRNGKILAAATLQDLKGADWAEATGDSAGLLYFYSLCVRAGERNKGYAKALVKAAFELAATEHKAMKLSPFTPMGAKHLAPAIAHIHARDYPQVRVLRSDLVYIQNAL